MFRIYRATQHGYAMGGAGEAAAVVETEQRPLPLAQQLSFHTPTPPLLLPEYQGNLDAGVNPPGLDTYPDFIDTQGWLDDFSGGPTINRPGQDT
jgi:hypothetical protein